MTWELAPFLPKFKFSRPQDVGVTGYLTLVSLWFYLELPPTILSPVFFADPAGAVVGKFMDKCGVNFRWYKNKTFWGSIAVGVVCYWSILFECTDVERVGISVAAVAVEAIGAEWDNLGLAGVVLVGWKVCEK